MSASNAETSEVSEGSETPEAGVDWVGLEIDVLPKWSGGSADVYVASHPTLGALALKRLKGPCIQDSKEYRQLHREVKIWRDLTHPNILQFIGIYESKEIVYIVSPLLQNGTVPQYIASNPDVDRVPFICDLAKGLSYLHQRGIVHGDIKGNNILVSSSLPVQGVVADFGLAKIADTQTVTSLKYAGTPRWQSPEIVLEGTAKNFKSDVYAFGMTVYEIISGKLPFEGSPTYALYAKILRGERPSPKPLSRSGYAYTKEWAIAQAAWDHDPERRPTMDGVVLMLTLPGPVIDVTKTRINTFSPSQTTKSSKKQSGPREENTRNPARPYEHSDPPERGVTSGNPSSVGYRRRTLNLTPISGRDNLPLRRSSPPL